MNNCVRLYRRVEKKEVPFEGDLAGVAVMRHGRCIRVLNYSGACIQVNHTPVKPERHADVAAARATIEIEDGTRVIARFQ